MSHQQDDQTNPEPTLQPIANWKRVTLISTVVIIGTALTTVSWISLNFFLAIPCAFVHFAVAVRMNHYLDNRVECSLCNRIMDPYDHCTPCWKIHIETAKERKPKPQPDRPAPPY